jgi:nitrous oxidase accessory protein NosD
MANSKPFALTLTCAIIFNLLGSTFANSSGNTVHVKSGASIQAVLDNANSGDTIIVEAGTYAEQLSVTTSGITLKGNNAVIVPPSTPVTNPCTDLAGPTTQAGICIAGSDIVYIDQPFDGEHKKVQSVGKFVKDVKVSGFTVNGFSGLNIAILGAQNADIRDNSVSAGPQYGILTVGSKSTEIRHNTVLPGGFIGICMDDLSDVEIARNDISGYYIGLCVQTALADIHDNLVHDSCIGAYVDPNISSAKLHDNTFKNTGTACNPDYGIAGILISGAQNTSLRSNTISGIGLDGQGAGLVITDDAGTGAVATGNDIRRNTFSGNNLDIYEATTGAGNVVKSNKCTTSVPASLCPGT